MSTQLSKRVKASVRTVRNGIVSLAARRLRDTPASQRK